MTRSAVLARRRILFVHQSSSLYGSDRAMLATVAATRALGGEAIVVVPDEGPLCPMLADLKAEVHIAPIGKITRSSASLKGLFTLNRDAQAASRALTGIVAGRRVDALHSNTLAALGGAIWARTHSVPHVWHIHEIVQNPRWVARVYGMLLSRFADRVVCNSTSTADWIVQRTAAKLKKPPFVMENALLRPPTVDAAATRAFRARYAPDDGTVLVGLIGRINRIKGHRVLVDAIDSLHARGLRNVVAVFIGDWLATDVSVVSALQDRVRMSPARSRIHFAGFIHDPWPVLAAMDILSVPSVQPESCGLVAAEAMTLGVPVVASDNHGLSTIIEHGSTGLLFETGNVEALADRLQALVCDPALRQRLGSAAALAAADRFSLDSFTSRMSALYSELFTASRN